MAETARPGAFSVLRRFVERGEQRAAQAEERCEFCGTAIGEGHRHMLEIATREVSCVCYPCSLLFHSEAASEGRFRLIPQRRHHLESFAMSDPQWESLRIPVGLAFLFYSSPAGKMVVYYPSPMGPTESLIRASVWAELVAQNPVLAGLEPDVEALLVNRAQGANDYFLVPIDDCYRLIGVLRTNWRGLSGGEEVWQEIGHFFERLQAQSESSSEWR